MEEENRSTSIDHLISIRQSAPQKLLDLPGLVIGIITSEAEKGASPSPDIELKATQEAVDFCTASGLGTPLSISTVEPLRAELAKRASTRYVTQVDGMPMVQANAVLFTDGGE